MWTARRIIALCLVALAANLAIGFVGAQLTATQPHSSSCPIQSAERTLQTFDSCSGDLRTYTFDPCSLATDGSVHCSVTIPDTNWGDWATWLACEFLVQLPHLALSIWQSIVSYVAAFIESVVSSVLNVALASYDAVLDSILAWWNSILSTLTGAVNELSAWVDSVAAQAGPLGPILVALLAALMIIAGVVGGYVAFIGIVALGKTIFNLL